MSDKRKYPRAGAFEAAHPGQRLRCVGCGNSGDDVGRVRIRVSYFRGDDEVVKCCRGCYVNVPLPVLLERTAAPGLAAAFDKLRAAALVVTTDIAQDILEDPCGSADREKEGFHRVAVTAVDRLNQALTVTP